MFTRLHYVHPRVNIMTMSEQSDRFGDLLQGVSLLTEALGKTANIQTMGSRSLRPPDVSVQIFLRKQRQVPRLTLVFPRDAQHIKRSTTDDLVLVANRIAPETSAEWRKKGQSFIDLQGHVFIEVPGLLIDKKVRRAQLRKQIQTHPVDPFADRASSISRYLLKYPPGESWGVRELSAITGVSLGTTSKIVRELEERDLVVVMRSGRSADVALTRPRELFKSWTAVYNWTRNLSLTVSAPVGDRKAFLKMLPRKIPSTSMPWAATLHAAASLVAPHAVWDQIHLYVDCPSATLLERFAADLNWLPDRDGRVTLMRPYYRHSVWQGVHDQAGVPVVDDLQLALDLWDHPARGREQAEYILQRKLPWILHDRD